MYLPSVRGGKDGPQTQRNKKFIYIIISMYRTALSLRFYRPRVLLHISNRRLHILILFNTITFNYILYKILL